MSQFDIAVGMDATTFGKGAAELYTKADARGKLFRGSEEGQQGGLKYTASWDVQAAPGVVLAPPPEDKWKTSIDAQGRHPKPEDRPVQNAFQVRLPQVHAKYTPESGKALEGTAEVFVFATLALDGTKVSITPLSVWLDESRMSGWDKLILNRVILKSVLAKMKEMLSGWSIPLPSLSPFQTPKLKEGPLEIKEFNVRIPELAQPQVAVQDGRLILASCLKSRGTVDISGFPWPPQPFFVLISQAMIRHFTHLIRENLTLQDEGEVPKLSLRWSYSAKIDEIDGELKETDSGNLQMKASFSFDAEAKVLGCPVATATGSL